jgi:hypothetical protein
MKNGAPGIDTHPFKLICRPLKLFGTLLNPFVALVVAYFLTRLGHFAHNAEYLCEYHNLPA